MWHSYDKDDIPLRELLQFVDQDPSERSEGIEMLSIGKSSSTKSPAAVGAWAQLLDEEETQAANHGFGAGVMVIGFQDELLRHIDDDNRALTEAAVLAIIDRRLGWADRTELIAPGRLGVVMQPVDDALALSHRARELHRELRSCSLEVDVSYSMRRRHGGLHAAAARADAALDTAIARRR